MFVEQPLASPGSANHIWVPPELQKYWKLGAILKKISLHPSRLYLIGTDRQRNHWVDIWTEGRHPKKKRLSVGHCPKGGGGVQPESKSFEVVLFSPSLTFFWTLNGGRGWVTRFQMFWGTFCLNIGWIFEFWAFTKVTSRLSKMGRYKSYLTGVQNEGGGSRPLLDNVQKNGTFFFGCLP